MTKISVAKSQPCKAQKERKGYQTACNTPPMKMQTANIKNKEMKTYDRGKGGHEKEVPGDLLLRLLVLEQTPALQKHLERRSSFVRFSEFSARSSCVPVRAPDP
jgi:hypothetical protein